MTKYTLFWDVYFLKLELDFSKNNLKTNSKQQTKTNMFVTYFNIDVNHVLFDKIFRKLFDNISANYNTAIILFILCIFTY